MNLEKIRMDFPILGKKINNQKIIYLDNAATSLKPKQVIDAMNSYYFDFTANVHRGAHKLSEEASIAFEESHSDVAKFINAKKEEIVFVRNTTEAFNMLMYCLSANNFFQEGDEILVSKMEHHSNILPWQFLEQRIGVKLEFVELTPEFELDLTDLESKLNDKTKLVSLTQASNVVGTINPIKEISKIVKNNNSETLFAVDAAQSVPHIPIDVKKLGCDFLGFSSHKMLGPTGIGVAFAKKELLEKLPPFQYGGGIITKVELHSAEWNSLPWKFEAGTPAIAEAIGLSSAIDYLQKIDFEERESHEIKLLAELLQDFERMNKVEYFCPKDVTKQLALVSFNVKGIHPHDVALALDETSNICVRSGMMCAEPLASSLNKEGIVRVAPYFYNTPEELYKFTTSLKEIIRSFG